MWSWSSCWTRASSPWPPHHLPHLAELVPYPGQASLPHPLFGTSLRHEHKDQMIYKTTYSTNVLLIWGLTEKHLYVLPRDLAGLMGVAAVLLGLCCNGLWSLAAAPWGLALLSWVGLRGVVLWRQGCMQRAVYVRATELQTLVHNSKTLTGLSRKALRLVQETEVISRGFTL